MRCPGVRHGGNRRGDTRLLSIAGQNPGEGTSRDLPYFLSHDQVDGLSIFYSEAGPEGRADAAAPARPSLFIPDVRAAVRAAVRSLSPGRARLSRFRTQRLAGSEDSSRIRSITSRDHESHFTEALGLSHYTLYMQDYGGPVGFRMALAHPERVDALIVQDAVAHNEGLGANWKTRRAFWADRAAQRSRAAHEPPVTGDDTDTSRRQRSERRALRPGSVDGRIRIPQPAGSGRHPERPVLRLPHQRRGLSEMAGMDAREAAAPSGDLGQVRPLLRSLGARGISTRRAERPRFTCSTQVTSRWTRPQTRLPRWSKASCRPHVEGSEDKTEAMNEKRRRFLSAAALMMTARR